MNTFKELFIFLLLCAVFGVVAMAFLATGILLVTLLFYPLMLSDPNLAFMLIIGISIVLPVGAFFLGLLKLILK